MRDTLGLHINELDLSDLEGGGGRTREGADVHLELEPSGDLLGDPEVSHADRMAEGHPLGLGQGLEDNLWTDPSWVAKRDEDQWT